jgi:hypothetical protein
VEGIFSNTRALPTVTRHVLSLQDPALLQQKATQSMFDCCSSGASLGYRMASIFAGGLSPLVATWLLTLGKGQPTHIAYYMIFLVAITAISVAFAKETNQDSIGA